MSDGEQTSIARHNLGLYRLTGFSGRQRELLQLHGWLTSGPEQPALAISGRQGAGKTTLATAAAWNLVYHFSDGIIRVGAAGVTRFRLYDIVRTMDSIFGTTLTRISEDRWGISILEQLYRRKRLLILDELSGATADDLTILADIIGHLHDAAGQSRILFIDRNFSPAIADLCQAHHVPLGGLDADGVAEFIRKRAPDMVQADALAHVDALASLTGGLPFTLQVVLGLLLEYPWAELAPMLAGMAHESGRVDSADLVAFAVENLAMVHPQTGPLLDRLVSASGGASTQAVQRIFWAELGSTPELERTLDALQARGLLDRDVFQGRIVMHPLVRQYMEQNAAMLGEEWDRRHAQYYVEMAEHYQIVPIERWPEIDVEWGNIYRGADWCTERMERIWRQPALDVLADEAVDVDGLTLPPELADNRDDLRLTRDYALALAHYAFWRHPPGILRWLAAGAAASLALADMRDYAWLQMNIGRQLFFVGQVDDAIRWLQRAAQVFDSRDLLTELAYAYTDLGTSYRVIDRPRQALAYFRAAFDCVAQLGDQRGLTTALMNLGSAYYGLNEFDQALREHRKALRIALRHSHQQQCASIYNSMGLAMEGLERYADAQQAYERALSLFRYINDVIGISTCYNNLGSVAYAQGDFDKALTWYELDLALSETRGTWTDMAATLHNLGHVALEQGLSERALAYFMQSRELYAAFDLEDYMHEEQSMIDYIHTAYKVGEPASAN
ncbi:MAG: tetratricopeptide repeat protein [Litorilinea sp.]